MPRQDGRGQIGKVSGLNGSSTYIDNTQAHVVEDSFNWGDVSSEVLLRAVDHVTERGDCVSFARNRKGTSGTITILAGDSRPKWYVSSTKAAEEVLIGIANDRAPRPDSA